MIANDLTTSILAKKIDSVINSSSRQKEIKDNLKKLSIDDSATIIYNEIKKNWRELLYNPTPIFNRIKSQVSPSTYQNIIYFYELYSKKLHLLSNFH